MKTALRALLPLLDFALLVLVWALVALLVGLIPLWAFLKLLRAGLL